MTDDRDQLLAARFAALKNDADDADWLDVRRRARGLRARVVAVGAAAALAVVVAAPALGLHRVIIDWFEAEPAPERVQLEFNRLTVMAPVGMDTGIIPNTARKVTEVRHDGNVHVLAVAPTRSGGFCFQWTELSGGCRKDRTPPPPPPRASPDLNRFLLGTSWSPDANGVLQQIGGNLLATETRRLVAEFADGTEAEIPVVWVSPPIDAGFYLYFVPPGHRRPGHHLAALVAEDADGEVIARQTFELTPAQEIERYVRLPDGQVASLPAKAIVDDARRIIDFRATNGQRIAVWVIPTTDGGRCYVHNRGGGCPPRELDVPMAAGIYGGARPVLFGGQVRDEVAVVELRYEDGDMERVKPVEGMILHEIPPTHYERGHRLELAIALDSKGSVVERQPMSTDSGVYPCAEPIDKGFGVKVCP